MDIRARIERARNLMYTVENWDAIVEEKRRVAAWGSGRRNDVAKVQTTLKHDRLEDAVLDVNALESHREKLFAQYWQEKEEITEIIMRCAPVNDWKILNRYLLGCELSEIPLTGKQKNPEKVIDKTVEKLQKSIDREEEIARLSEGVRKLIEGGRRKCKHCETGFVRFEKEDAEKFIFLCDGCGRRTKADKKPKERTEEE